MKPFHEDAIMAYLQQGTYLDKAGAYAIQDVPHLIERIEGDPETVLGLPTRLIRFPTY
jgi:predicted house-cleaning NTP pyrophosphatase (Maf/HAM1 superfamily)